MEPMDRRDFIKTVLVATGTNLILCDGFSFGGSPASSYEPPRVYLRLQSPRPIDAL